MISFKLWRKFSLEMGKFHQHGMLDPSNHQVAQKIDESNLTSSERLFSNFGVVNY